MRGDPVPRTWTIRAAFALVSLATVLLMVFAFTGGTDVPLLFVIFFVVALVWNTYWWLFRIALSASIDNDVLIAKAALRTRRVRLDDLRAVRPMRLISIVTILEVKDERPVMIMASKDIGAFAEQLGRLKPELSVKLGSQGRLEQRIRGGPAS